MSSDFRSFLVENARFSDYRVESGVMRVALFVTCFNDTLFPQAGRATVELLERVGCTVDFPLEQTCCGQMHVNSGYGHEAEGLM